MNQQYLTVDEFIERVGEAEADNIAGSGLRGQREIDRLKIAGAVAYAESIVYGYVSARYKQAFDVVPESVKDWATAIAHYRLRWKAGDTSGAAEQVKARYDEAMSLLRDVQAGRLALDAYQGGVGDAPAQETPVLHSGRPSRADEILDSFHLSVGGRR